LSPTASAKIFVWDAAEAIEKRAGLLTPIDPMS
jgi:hypothetical protein